MSEPTNPQLADSPVTPVAHSRQAASAISFTPSERRVAMRQTESGAQTSSASRTHPDEFLFDGGDRNLPIHYDSLHRRGLDTEDTVVEFLDSNGEFQVQATNRVAIYSPRFAAVRVIQGVHEDQAVEQTAGIEEKVRGVGLDSTVGLVNHQRNAGLQDVRVRTQASGMDARTHKAQLDSNVTLGENTTLLNVFQDLNFVQTGQFIQGEAAQLALGIQAAIAWSHDRFPVITASTSAAVSLEAWFQAAEYVGVDDEHLTPGQLRIVKLADRKSARPGEIVTFTIRYDNIGEKPLQGIRIVDNLTPRLEYVDDSASSDRDGRLVVEDNDEGSLILKFQVDGELPGREGGAVTFKARVR